MSKKLKIMCTFKEICQKSAKSRHNLGSQQKSVLNLLEFREVTQVNHFDTCVYGLSGLEKAAHHNDVFIGLTGKKHCILRRNRKKMS